VILSVNIFCFHSVTNASTNADRITDSTIAPCDRIQPENTGTVRSLPTARQYLGDCNAREYLDAEYRASRRRYGVWQVEGGIARPWEFRKGRRAAVIPDGTTPDGRRYSCKEIGSYARAQELLRQGQTYLDSNRDGEACESLRR